MSDSESVERVVPAEASRIFALLADPARHRDIDGSGTLRGPKGRSGPLVLGSRFGMRMRLGLPYMMVNTVVEFEQDRRIAWQGYPVGPLARVVGGRIWRYELEPVPGGTLVRETWDISEERVKALVQAARPLTRQAMQRTLERLGRLLAEPLPA